jgi:hypothetical protein
MTCSNRTPSILGTTMFGIADASRSHDKMLVNKTMRWITEEKIINEDLFFELPTLPAEVSSALPTKLQCLSVSKYR